MKKNYTLFLAGILSFSAISQTNLSDFEDLSLPANSFWNGSDLSGQFNSNSVIFKNKYDTAFGGYWASGVVYSSMTDDTTAGFGNLYSCIAAEGYNGSSTYGIVNPQMDSVITIPNYGRMKGFWVNNSTYAYLSMREGDAFGKKFGDTVNASGVNDGTNGNDFLKVTVYGEYSDSVEFYLADFRGAASSDYILSDWTYVSLSGLNPNTKIIKFGMTSSDNGSFGMNTPGFFCIDNVEYETSLSLSDRGELNNVKTFPNPTSNLVQVLFQETKKNISYKLIDVTGRDVESTRLTGTNRFQLDLTNQNKGVYLLRIVADNKVVTKRIIKE